MNTAPRFFSILQLVIHSHCEQSIDGESRDLERDIIQLHAHFVISFLP